MGWDLHSLTYPRVPKLRHPALKLTKRVKLANEDETARFQHACCLAEEMTEFSNVLQDEILDHQVKGFGRRGPRQTDVVGDEAHLPRANPPASTLQHPVFLPVPQPSSNTSHPVRLKG
jgi:hypothetical protein